MIGYSAEKIRELEAGIGEIHSLPARIDALNDLAWKLRHCDKDRSYQLSQRACELSKSGEFASQPYRKGLAIGLINSGIINISRDKLEVSLSQSIEGLAILEGLAPLPNVVDAWTTICWIYLYLGEYPTAFDYALMSLQLARELGCQDREGHALDALGSAYGFSAEYVNSIENHEEALRIFREIDDPEDEAMALNNMACSLLDMGNYDEAYPASLKSIELSRQLGFFEEELVFATTIADILVKKGEFDQAERYLQSAYQKTIGQELDQTQAFILVSMARLSLAQKKFRAAEPYLQEALSVAKRHDFKNDQMICHQLLSEVFESTDMPYQALKHFKQYFDLKEAITGAETARKISVLKAAHQLEISKREADIYRKQNIELQHEIEERKKAEALLEDLAIRDPLTNVLNRRQFSMLAIKEIERAHRHGRPLSMLMLDIDHFKEVNDRHGHLTGDRVLSNVAARIESILRDTDIVGRHGGDEFVILLPETTSKKAFEVAERLRLVVERTNFEALGGSIKVTISLGIAQLPASSSETPISMDDLHHQADLALYTAKRAGRNQTHVYTPEP
ncbi:MAG TPA: diguanylate cyclase [Anaerolineales bacterium]|jgi:diguanylate cyclase (GGDEF)-like protein